MTLSILTMNKVLEKQKLLIYLRQVNIERNFQEFKSEQKAGLEDWDCWKLIRTRHKVAFKLPWQKKSQKNLSELVNEINICYWTLFTIYRDFENFPIYTYEETIVITQTAEKHFTRARIHLSCLEGNTLLNLVSVTKKN